MPAETRQLIIHRLDKDRQGPASFHLREEPLELSEAAKTFVGRVHELYARRPSKGYGKFEDDPDVFPVPQRVSQWWVTKESDFVVLTGALMNILAARAGEEPLATGGFVVFAHLSNGPNDWLLVAVINNTNGSAIDEQSLDVHEAAHVDIENLRVAGRIDLTAWRAEEARYIGFLKGRGDVSDYFKRFLGCNDLVESRIETQKCVAALKAFAKGQGLAEEKADDFLKAAFYHCEELRKASEPLDVETLCHAVWPADPDTLKTFLARDEWQIAGGYVPDKRAFRALVKFAAKTKLWSITFEREAITNGQLTFDPQSGSLTIHELPEPLRVQLIEEGE